jgi:hypothetical protein
MNEPTDNQTTQKSSQQNFSSKPIIKDSTRRVIAFIILCISSVLILFTGPEFSFGLQVVLASILLFFLFWLAT